MFRSHGAQWLNVLGKYDSPPPLMRIAAISCWSEHPHETDAIDICGLKDLHNETLEIARLGHPGKNGVVRCLASLFQ